MARRRHRRNPDAGPWTLRYEYRRRSHTVEVIPPRFSRWQGVVMLPTEGGVEAALEQAVAYVLSRDPNATFATEGF